MDEEYFWNRVSCVIVKRLDSLNIFNRRMDILDLVYSRILYNCDSKNLDYVY